MTVVYFYSESLDDGIEFKVVGDPDKLKAEQEEQAKQKEKEAAAAEAKLNGAG